MGSSIVGISGILGISMPPETGSSGCGRGDPGSCGCGYAQQLERMRGCAVLVPTASGVVMQATPPPVSALQTILRVACTSTWQRAAARQGWPAQVPKFSHPCPSSKPLDAAPNHGDTTSGCWRANTGAVLEGREEAEGGGRATFCSSDMVIFRKVTDPRIFLQFYFTNRPLVSFLFRFGP